MDLCLLITLKKNRSASYAKKENYFVRVIALDICQAKDYAKKGNNHWLR